MWMWKKSSPTGLCFWKLLFFHWILGLKNSRQNWRVIYFTEKKSSPEESIYSWFSSKWSNWFVEIYLIVHVLLLFFKDTCVLFKLKQSLLNRVPFFYFLLKPIGIFLGLKVSRQNWRVIYFSQEYIVKPRSPVALKCPLWWSTLRLKPVSSSYCDLAQWIRQLFSFGLGGCEFKSWMFGWDFLFLIYYRHTVPSLFD